ncbi:hypothetical protein TNCV_1267451 [Trichonephila clavipes]|nr:hypothetical protein TNCV_1267451 [Trichonephila clavipes]
MWFPHTNTIVITAEIKSGFVAKDSLVAFRCSIVSSSTATLQTEASIGGRRLVASRTAHVTGAAIPNDLQPGAFV